MYDLGFIGIVVLDGLPGLYGLKYDSATACGPPLYLYSYKLVGSATAAVSRTHHVWPKPLQVQLTIPARTQAPF